MEGTGRGTSETCRLRLPLPDPLEILVVVPRLPAHVHLRPAGSTSAPHTQHVPGWSHPLNNPCTTPIRILRQHPLLTRYKPPTHALKRSREAQLSRGATRGAGSHHAPRELERLDRLVGRVASEKEVVAWLNHPSEAHEEPRVAAHGHLPDIPRGAQGERHWPRWLAPREERRALGQKPEQGCVGSARDPSRRWYDFGGSHVFRDDIWSLVQVRDPLRRDVSAPLGQDGPLAGTAPGAAHAA